MEIKYFFENVEKRHFLESKKFKFVTTSTSPLQLVSLLHLLLPSSFPPCSISSPISLCTTPAPSPAPPLPFSAHPLHFSLLIYSYSYNPTFPFIATFLPFYATSLEFLEGSRRVPRVSLLSIGSVQIHCTSTLYSVHCSNWLAYLKALSDSS